MTWTKFAVRDAEGRLFTGPWANNFSGVKPPRLWSRRHDAQYRIDRLNEYAHYEWARKAFSFPLEIIEVVMEVKEAA